MWGDAIPHQDLGGRTTRTGLFDRKNPGEARWDVCYTTRYLGEARAQRAESRADIRGTQLNISQFHIKINTKVKKNLKKRSQRHQIV